jgi:diguanylate cyclase (GGDEF)-like protein
VDRSLDAVARVGATLLEAPVAVVLVGDGEDGRVLGDGGTAFATYRSLREELDQSSSGLLLLTDARLHPRLASTWIVSEQALIACAAVRLDAAGACSLAVFDRRPREWTDAHVSQLRDLASLAANQLELEEARRQRDEASKARVAAEERARAAADAAEGTGVELDLPAIAHVLHRILSGEDARQAIVHAAVEIAGASSAHLAERVGDEALRVTASAGLNLIGVDVRLDAPSATARAYLTGEARFLADPAQDPLVSRELLEIARARSLMWQPIRSHEDVLGVLCVCWAERVDDVSARAARAVALLTDETAVALAHHDALRRLAAQAVIDPLTELPNRRAFEETLGEVLEGGRYHDEPPVLALLDLDRFKHYNDTRGHGAGDELLGWLAHELPPLLGTGDVLARWGGDELAILLRGAGPGGARETLERLRAAMPEGQSCSIGYATWDGREDPPRLLDRVMRAVARAKATGRDRVYCAERA